MGIDRAVCNVSSAIMFDQRGQMFNLSNKWLPNPVADQQLFVMNAMNELDGVNSPLGTGALLNSPAFAVLGSSSPSRLLSDRSASTDSSNDPDGPAMDNGNCLTHDFDDSVYDGITLGTPNSFISDQYPQSPDMFSEHRRRQMSASSSTYTYSPYSPHEEPQIALNLQPCMADTPALDRQTSLAMVEEVLGTAPDCDQPFLPFPKDDDSLKGEGSEDSCLPPYPSPSFVEHFNGSNAMTQSFITSSQDEEFFAAFRNTEATTGYQCEVSPTTESSPAPASNCNNNCNIDETQSTHSQIAQESVATSTEEAATITYLQLSSVTGRTVERQNTNYSDLIADSMPTNSLDVHEMMQDFVDTLPQSRPLQTFTTLSVEDISVASISESSGTGQETVELPSTNVSPQSKTASSQINNENIEPSTSSENVDTATMRRERNNAACRQSRKRRKDKKLEEEKQVTHFTEENVQLRAQIEELEVECKRVKQHILSAVTNNSR